MRSLLKFAALSSLFGLLAIGLLLIGSFGFSAAAQDQAKQQRPRRVAGADEQAAKGTQKTQTEEVAEGDVVRVDTQLVSVPAVVTNSGGRPVAGLREENFLVYENGQPQKIANFATTDVPFEIALLCQAANAFVAALRPGDRVAIVAFNTARKGQALAAKVDVLTQLTDDRK